MPSFSAAKDTRGHSLFRSVVARMLWRLLTWRLTSAGRWMLIPTLFLFAYATTSLTLQAFIPFCYVAALWLFALLAPLFFKPRVKLTVNHADHVIAGETMQVEVEIEQLGTIGGHDLHVMPHGLPASIDPVEIERRAAVHLLVDQALEAGIARAIDLRAQFFRGGDRHALSSAAQLRQRAARHLDAYWPHRRAGVEE